MGLGFFVAFLKCPFKLKGKSVLALLLRFLQNAKVSLKISMFTGPPRKSYWNYVEVLCHSLWNCRSACHLHILVKPAPLINNLNIRQWAFSHKTAKFLATFKFSIQFNSIKLAFYSKRLIFYPYSYSLFSCVFDFTGTCIFSSFPYFQLYYVQSYIHSAYITYFRQEWGNDFYLTRTNFCSYSCFAFVF